MIRIAILEDDVLVRDTLAAFFGKQDDCDCILAAGSVPEFLLLADELLAGGQLTPDIVLTDIGLPGTSGIDAIPLIRKRFADVSMMIFSIYADNDRIFKALCAGAVGY